MKSLVYKLNRAQMRVLSGICEFKNSERGDTIFISIILIVAIVVVLAAAFMALANGGMEKITQMFNDFLDSL